jgi:hypothetical protein
MALNALAEAPLARVRVADPDAELVARARADPREFLGLYDRYFDRVLGYARLRVADGPTCEDVTSQDRFSCVSTTMCSTSLSERLARFAGMASARAMLSDSMVAAPPSSSSLGSLHEVDEDFSIDAGPTYMGFRSSGTDRAGVRVQV